MSRVSGLSPQTSTPEYILPPDKCSPIFAKEFCSSRWCKEIRNVWTHFKSNGRRTEKRYWVGASAIFGEDIAKKESV